MIESKKDLIEELDNLSSRLHERVFEIQEIKRELSYELLKIDSIKRVIKVKMEE